MPRCLRPRQCRLPHPQPGFSATPTDETPCRRQRGADRERREMERGRMEPAGHKAAVFSRSGTGILIGTEVCRGIMSLHITSPDSSAALAEPQHEFLPKKHAANKKCIRDADTYLGCWMDSPSRALAGRTDRRTDRQPGLAGPPRERGCGQRSTAAPSATAAQTSLLPQALPCPRISPPVSLPTDEIKGISRILPSHFG